MAKTEMESQIKLMDLSLSLPLSLSFSLSASVDLAMTAESAEDSAENLLKINRFS